MIGRFVRLSSEQPLALKRVRMDMAAESGGRRREAIHPKSDGSNDESFSA
jgi:hypothetical protein